MNSEQLQDWLTELNERLKNNTGKHTLKDVEQERKFLVHETGKTHYLISYLSSNYTDVDLVQPVLAQLLACYYRGGVLRYFIIQCMPSMIHLYLLALAKHQRKSISMFETFFLAIYNEEILAGGTLSESPAKKIEEIRIPSTRFPSVYHDPKKLNLTSDIALKPGTPAYVQMVVRIGPYKSLDRITPENRQIILTRLLKSVTGCLCRLSRDIICRYICVSTIAICQSGFSFPESDLRSRVFEDKFSPEEVSDDFSKKPRLRVSSQYLMESLNGLYFALFNGAPELAVQAVDAVHQRALYEFYADVILVTNSIRETLLESSFQKNECLMVNRVSMGKFDGRRGSEMVTNASLQLKKMPEDIALVPNDDNKGYYFSDSVENFKKRIAMKVEQHKIKHHFGYHRRKPESNMENVGDIELAPKIDGESLGTNAVFDDLGNKAIGQNLVRRNSLSLELKDSTDNASAPCRQDQVRNGSLLREKSGEVVAIDSSLPKTVNHAEATKSAAKISSGQECTRIFSDFRHMDSVNDVFESTSL